MWVFWVHASNAVRFEQAYREIAAQVELPGRDDPKTDILRAVHSWLCDESNGRWLMVVDNADDDRVFASASTIDDPSSAVQRADPAKEAAAPLASFLPQAATGWILVTSRDLVAAVNLVGARHNVVEVDPMGEQDALTLLKSKTRVDESSEGDARALVKTLEGIPLAVTHAAAYIEVNKAMVGIPTYLELFHKSEENQAYLLNDKKARDMRRDASVSSAVITTWQLSFEQIRKTEPVAADLLSLMTMFDRQGIPEHVLYDGKTQLQFVEAVGPLLRFSLVRTQAGTQPDQQVKGQLLEMHSLVQLATRHWLQIHGQVNLWERASLRIMAAEFPSGQPETWAVCRTLLPHSTKLLGYSVEEDEKARLDRATMATNTGWYSMLMGEYGRAEQVERSAVTTREEVLGLEHPDTLTSVSHLGSVLSRQGKYDEAEAMHQRALEESEKMLGREHPDTLTSVSNLGLLLENQGKYQGAEAMHRRALEGREKALGREHPDTLTSVSNLGSVLWSQGRLADAEGLETRVMDTRKRALGDDHPYTLTAMANLAVILKSQGRSEEALSLMDACVRVRARILGLGHPDTESSTTTLNRWRLESLDLRA
jgi:tetratricopeptide (TPR) repeat protein